ncbi:MAG: hypothetical protein B5M54_10695 [Candidatus Aminicenantes bacterium 4484_214]|nr:MAG: hypothetical protein B5M54_10695 [Candidatus Aminicenantes bacterium 4484_214]RLE06877.1 MAG: hypothetical protein DRJ06_06985 [Candidatus Aminicenantes bacterium]
MYALPQFIESSRTLLSLKRNWKDSSKKNKEQAMTKSRYPRSRAVNVEQEIDRIIKDLFSPGGSFLSLVEGLIPRVDVREDKRRIIVEIEVPGVALEDLSIYLKMNVLIIKGVKKEEPHPQKVKYLRMEREFGTFQREIFLSAPVIPTKSEATLHQGLLTIVLQKDEASSEGIKIPVKSPRSKKLREDCHG